MSIKSRVFEMLEQLLSLAKRKHSGGITPPFRHWRMTIFSPNTSGAIVLAELKYLDISGNNLCVPRKATATANGQYSPGYSPDRAFDGIIPADRNQGSHWQFNGSAGTLPWWIQIDLGVPTSLASYKIGIPQGDSQAFINYSPNRWSIHGSNDGSNWVEMNTQNTRDKAFWTGAIEKEFVF